MRKENLKRKGVDDAENASDNEEQETLPVADKEQEAEVKNSNDNTEENGDSKEPGTDDDFEDAENGEDGDSKGKGKAKTNGNGVETSKEEVDEETDDVPLKKSGRSKAKPAKKANGNGDVKANGDGKEDEGEEAEEAEEEDAEDKNNDGSDYESGSKKGKKMAAAKRTSPKKKEVKHVKPKPAKKSKKQEIEEEDEEEEEEYEVEDIVDHRKERGGKMVYRIRWKNFGANDDTWEPEATLSCPEIIKRYKAKLEKEESAPPGKKSKVAPKAAAVQKTVVAKKGRTKAPTKKRSAKDDEAEDEDEEEDETEYEVEKIIEVHFKRNGMRDYLVRWKGFSSKDDTWEPEEHLNCKDLIAKFNEKLDKTKNATVKELRINRKPTERLKLVEIGRKSSRRNATKGRVNYYDGE